MDSNKQKKIHLFQENFNSLNIKQKNRVKQKNIISNSLFTLPTYCRNKKKQYLCTRG